MDEYSTHYLLISFDRFMNVADARIYKHMICSKKCYPHDTTMMSLLLSSLSWAVGCAGYRIAASKWSPSTRRTGYKWVSVPQWGIWKIHYEISIKSRICLRVWEWLNLHFGKKNTKNANKNKQSLWKCATWLSFSRKTWWSPLRCCHWMGGAYWVSWHRWYGTFQAIQLSNPWGFHLCHRMNRRLPSTMMDFDV